MLLAALIGLLAPATAGFLLGPAMTPAAAAQGKPKKPEKPSGVAPDDVNELSIEVAALQTIRDLELTEPQREALAKMAAAIVKTPRTRQPAKASANLKKTMRELRDALVNNDEKRVEELSEKLDSLQEREKPEIDDEVHLETAARAKLPEFIRLLGARQLAQYVGHLSGDFEEPVEFLLAAIGKAAGLKDEDYLDLRMEVSEELAWQLSGVDPAKVNKYRLQVGELLDKARKTKPDDKTQKANLDKAARELTGSVSGLTVCRNVVEHRLALLLSNPRLPAALEACKNGK
jgi:hypothetical protein